MNYNKRRDSIAKSNTQPVRATLNQQMRITSYDNSDEQRGNRIQIVSTLQAKNVKWWKVNKTKYYYSVRDIAENDQWVHSSVNIYITLRVPRKTDNIKTRLPI